MTAGEVEKYINPTAFSGGTDIVLHIADDRMEFLEEGTTLQLLSRRRHHPPHQPGPQKHPDLPQAQTEQRQNGE